MKRTLSPNDFLLLIAAAIIGVAVDRFTPASANPELGAILLIVVTAWAISEISEMPPGILKKALKAVAWTFLAILLVLFLWVLVIHCLGHVLPICSI